MTSNLRTLLDDIHEGFEALEVEGENKALLDALLLGAGQGVARHEIVAYGSQHAMAIELAQYKIAKLLEDAVEEEMTTAKTYLNLRVE